MLSPVHIYAFNVRSSTESSGGWQKNILWMSDSAIMAKRAGTVWYIPSVTSLHYLFVLSILQRKYTGWFYPSTKISGRQRAKCGRGNGRKENASSPAAILKSGYIYRKGEQIKDAETITCTCGLFFSWDSNGSGGNDSPFTLEGV